MGQLCQTEDLTEDHKPDTPAEQARIERKGGRVFAPQYDDGIPGPARVWLADADLPGLAMSRSLGDTVAKQAGVVSTPECFSRRLVAEDRLLILATDGLWEFMTSQECVDIAARFMKGHRGNVASDPKAASRALLEESTRRWKREEPVIDDTTILVVYLN